MKTLAQDEKGQKPAPQELACSMREATQTLSVLQVSGSGQAKKVLCANEQQLVFRFSEDGASFKDRSRRNRRQRLTRECRRTEN